MSCAWWNPVIGNREQTLWIWIYSFTLFYLETKKLKMSWERKKTHIFETPLEKKKNLPQKKRTPFANFANTPRPNTLAHMPACLLAVTCTLEGRGGKKGYVTTCRSWAKDDEKKKFQMRNPIKFDSMEFSEIHAFEYSYSNRGGPLAWPEERRPWRKTNKFQSHHQCNKMPCRLREKRE
jgi:hypothetical protein